MNLRNKFFSIAGAVALTASMAMGVVAQDPHKGEADAFLNTTCTVPTSVSVAMNGRFDIDTTVYQESYSDTIVNGTTITLDLTCSWSYDFSVEASIGDFEYQDGAAPTGTLEEFSGESFQLRGGSMDTYDGPYSASEPRAWHPYTAPSVFNAFLNPGDVAMNNRLLNIFGAEIASPGKTVSTWNAQLVDVPANIAPGEYKAPLTVELKVN